MFTEFLNMLQPQTTNVPAATAHNPNETDFDEKLTQSSVFAKHLSDANDNMPSPEQSGSSGGESSGGFGGESVDRFGTPTEAEKFIETEIPLEASTGISGLDVGKKEATIGIELPLGGKGLPQGDKGLPQGDKGLPQGDRGLPQGDKSLSQDRKDSLQPERTLAEAMQAPRANGLVELMSNQSTTPAIELEQARSSVGPNTVDRITALEISQRMMEQQLGKPASGPAAQMKPLDQTQGLVSPTTQISLATLTTSTQPIAGHQTNNNSAGSLSSQASGELALASSAMSNKTGEATVQAQLSNNGTVDSANMKPTDTSSRLSTISDAIPALGKQTKVPTSAELPGASGVTKVTTPAPASAAEVAMAMHTSPAGKTLSEEIRKNPPAQAAQLGTQEHIDDSARNSLANRRIAQGSNANVNVQRYDALAGAMVSNTHTMAGDQALRDVSAKMSDLGATAADGKSAIDAADRTLATHQRTQIAVSDTARAIPSAQSLTDASARELGSAVHDQVMRSMSRQTLAQGRLTIQLNPRELGALDIEFSTERGELQVAIVVRESMTRELLDSGLARLRQSLQEAGINVGDLDVRQESKQDQQQADSRKHSDGGAIGMAQTPEIEAEANVIGRSDGLFDIYV